MNDFDGFFEEIPPDYQSVYDLEGNRYLLINEREIKRAREDQTRKLLQWLLQFK